MMKSNAMLRGSSAGLAAIIQVNTQVGFLTDRQESVGVSPIEASKGYVWRRVFLQGKGHRA